MTRVQYGKLLVAQAKKKMADETREMQLEGGAFRKLQIERFRGDASKKVDDVKTTKANVTAVMEAHRARNYEVSSAVRQSSVDAATQIHSARAKHQDAVRQIVDVAKKVQSPRKAVEGVLESRLAMAQEVRHEREAIHKAAETLEAEEKSRKAQIVERVQHETGPQALLASSMVARTERVQSTEEVKTMRKEGEAIIKQEKEVVMQTRQRKMKSVNDAKRGAKSARVDLSSRKKEESDELRRKKGDIGERRTQLMQEGYVTKRGKRDKVLADRRPQAIAQGGLVPFSPRTPGTPGSMMTGSPMSPPGTASSAKTSGLSTPASKAGGGTPGSKATPMS